MQCWNFRRLQTYKFNPKRNELLNPILKQEKEIIDKINESYGNAIYANSTITGYLESARKVKATQQEALSLVGLQGKDTVMTNSLLKVSELVNAAVQKGKEIDVKSNDAYAKINEISNQIKKLTSKN